MLGAGGKRMDRIELRNSRSPGWGLIMAVKLGIGLFVGGATLIGLVRGVPFGQAWPVGLVALGVLGAGLFDLIQMMDQRVQLTLTPEGLRDHRMQPPRLLPWSEISAMHQDNTDGHTVALTMRSPDTLGSGSTPAPVSTFTINIQLERVDVTSAQFKAMVRRFAPHVVMSTPPITPPWS